MTVPATVGPGVAVPLGESRVCVACRMAMRSGTLAVMLPTGRVEHAVAATCRRRAAQRVARFGPDAT